MVAILQTKFPNAIYSPKTVVFWFKFHWRVFIRFQLAICQYFAPNNHYLNQRCPSLLMDVCVTRPRWVKWPRQNGCHFADDVFECISVRENAPVFIQIPLKPTSLRPRGSFHGRFFVIQIRWKPHSALIHVVVQWPLWKFCTWHDSCAVVACRKFCSDIKPYNGVTVKPTFHRILITMEKSFVRCSWSNATLPYCTRTEPVYTARPAQNGGHFADNVMCIF